MMVAIDLLKRLYSTSSLLPVLARSVGLIATDALTPVKVTYPVVITITGLETVLLVVTRNVMLPQGNVDCILQKQPPHIG